jgi:AcrR family transcriptional regulator
MVSQVVVTESHEALLDSATQVFSEHGFAGARVDSIARLARVNKAMIYYHFKSKRGLYQAVLLRLFQGVLGEIERVVRDEADPRRRLIVFYSGVARIFAERPALPRIMLREVLSGGAAFDAETAKTLSGILAFVARAVEEGVRKGLIRPAHPLIVHLSALAPLLLFFASQPFRAKVLPNAAPGVSMPTPEQMLEHLALMIERGLEPVPAA